MLNRFVKYYEEDLIAFPDDWNTLPTNAEAKVGLVQLEKYNDMMNVRRIYAKNYYMSLGKDVYDKYYSDNCNYSHIPFIVEDKNKVMKLGLENKIQLGEVIEYSIPRMNAYSKFVRENEEFPISDYYSNHTINFPVSNKLSKKNIDKVITFIKSNLV